ncbi:MAG: HupE/UreJ family protein [Verrucomicrobia bacterium]|nr:HupE/UreJ family protein [Verrucomicrobiota bacterium]
MTALRVPWSIAPRTALLPMLLWIGSLALSGHEASTALMTLERSGSGLRGRFEIPIRDMDALLGLDANDDGTLTWGELRAREADWTAYLASRIQIQTPSGPRPAVLGSLEIGRRLDEPVGVQSLSFPPTVEAGDLRLEYRVLSDFDALHRCLTHLGSPAQTVILNREGPYLSIPTDEARGPADGGRMIHQGLHHIWTGYDHLLFLMALILPAVLQRSPAGWVPAARARTVFLEVLRVVTAFTVAHSITLLLATLGWVRLPSRWVESVIAASIAVAAVLMLFPGRPPSAETLVTVPGWRRNRAWLIAFGFGLIHGFGFASILSELELPAHRLLRPLLEFNLGVELGQLAVVAAVLPMALMLRRSPCYRNWILPGGVLVTLAIAMGWLAERTLDLQFMPF